jgi:hypothetical protein
MERCVIPAPFMCMAAFRLLYEDVIDFAPHAAAAVAACATGAAILRPLT